MVVGHRRRLAGEGMHQEEACKLEELRVCRIIRNGPRNTGRGSTYVAFAP